jgi:hypothetical protein
MAAPILEDYQWWFGFGGEPGVVFGIDTDYDIVRMEGQEAISVRSGTRDLPREDGAVPGMHLMNRKTPIFDVEAIGDLAYNEVRGFFRKSRSVEGELHWKLPDWPQQFMNARVLARSNQRDGFTTGRIPFTLAFECADPRIYGTELHQQTIGIYNPAGGGVDWEIDWEVDFSDPGFGADEVVHNAGNDRAYPIIKVHFGTGTLTDFVLTNVTTGVTFSVTTTFSAGQILTGDMEARIRGSGGRIIDLSGASRYGSWDLPRTTFYLQPGDNIIRFEITGTTTDSTASLTWRDTSY